MIYNSFRSYLYEMTARDAIADIKNLKYLKTSQSYRAAESRVLIE